jgi:hypothetical protein
MATNVKDGISQSLRGTPSDRKIAVDVENLSATDVDIRDLDASQDNVEVVQTTHDDLNANANIQVGDVDVSGGNPVPVSFPSGVEVTQDTHDDLNANANLQAGNTDVANTVIGSDNLVHVKEAETSTYYMITDTPNPSTTFVGKTYDLDAASSAAVWQIRRDIVSGTQVISQYANDDNTYTHIWNNRESLFGSPPFANALSIQFDGVNDYIDVADNAAIDFDFRTEAASWNFWVKTSNTSAVTYFEKQSSNTGWRIYITGNDLTVELRATGTGDRIRVRTTPANNVGDTINDGSWHMITVTYDGSGDASGVSMYVDGVSESVDIQNDTLTGDTSNAGNAAIASRSGGSNSYGPGNMDEVSIWDTELTSGEVTTVYNSGVPIDLQDQGLSPITASLTYWARMGDGINDVYPTIEDVESSITGTMTNMTPGDIEGAVPG